MATNGMLEPRVQIPDVGGRPQMAGLFALFKRIPVASALLITIFDVEFIILIGMVVKTAKSSPHPDLLTWSVVAILAAGALTVLGWWRVAGFNRPVKWRQFRLVWLPVLSILVVPFFAGFRLLDPLSGAFVLLLYTLVAFRVELLYRGVILQILSPGGRRRAVFLSALLFAVSSAAGALVFAPQNLWSRVAGAFCFGILLGALRLRTNTIWISVVLNVVIGLTLRFSPWFPVYLNEVLPAILLAYGVFLLRDPQALVPDRLLSAPPPAEQHYDRRSMMM